MNAEFQKIHDALEKAADMISADFCSHYSNTGECGPNTVSCYAAFAYRAIADLAALQARFDACFEDAEIALASKEAETIERCAKVCDGKLRIYGAAADEAATDEAGVRLHGYTWSAWHCAAAIRALGKGT